AFYYDYKDLQLSAATCLTDDPASCNTNTTNASDATIKGLELEGKLRTSADGMLRANAAFTNAEFGEYRPVPTIDFAGQSLDRAPTATVGLGYT
ncbi:TonB-dependent receptor, partial [Acinetobacter baumannii]|nr:TonB-dependent receptor [Acinetobacter baumannii]